MTTLILSLVIIGIAALIRGVIIPAPPFPLFDGVRILATAVATGMTALRFSTTGLSEDEYVAALPSSSLLAAGP